MKPALWARWGTWLLAALLVCAASSRADTVASLLGNFTINQFSGLRLTRESVEVHQVVVFGQVPALAELHKADADGNGVTTEEERNTYVERLAKELGQGLDLRIDGAALPLRVMRWSSSLPTEQGGFSFRVDVYLSAPLLAAPAGAARNLQFVNRNFEGRIGWNEIAVEAAPRITAFEGNAYANSLTNALNEALKSLPEGGPLAEREVQLQFAAGPLPDSAHALALRPGVGAGPASVAKNSWLERQTRRLIDSISTPSLTPIVLLLCLLGALALGALHALSPGHGKTLVGAYLIGSRGTARHAFFLGLTVTLTHTAGIFLLGFATLFASHFIEPERMVPLLSAIAAVLVFGMGSTLLVQRTRAARRVVPIFHPAQPAPLSLRPLGAEFHSDGSHWHSHGGTLHSHLPPNRAAHRITWRSLLALGVSGGLVPCPSALVLLLAAVAVNRTSAGMLLVLAFSAGLAITLTLVGLAFLYARSRIPRLGLMARWPHLLPVSSAAAITLIGVILCAAAVQGFR
jgi:ABC-type nickel/cobalt efflux system permease component RcnA